MMDAQKFRKLKVWDKAIDFVEDVYSLTKEFPNSEKYGLISQLRRAATSISLNIAEGSGSSSDKEFGRFLEISLRSAYEVMCALEISKRLDYCTEEQKNVLLEKCDELCAMLSGLRKKLKVK